MQEAGLKNFVATPWYGVMAPGNLPAPIAERLNREINAALRKPDVVAQLREAGRDDLADVACRDPGLPHRGGKEVGRGGPRRSNATAE